MSQNGNFTRDELLWVVSRCVDLGPIDNKTEAFQRWLNLTDETKVGVLGTVKTKNFTDTHFPLILSVHGFQPGDYISVCNDRLDILGSGPDYEFTTPWNHEAQCFTWNRIRVATADPETEVTIRGAWIFDSDLLRALSKHSSKSIQVTYDAAGTRPFLMYQGMLLNWNAKNCQE